MMRRMGGPRVAVMNALARHPRLLLVGAPGSGKSTVAAFLTTTKGRAELAGALGRDPVPFLVPVRSLPAAPWPIKTLTVSSP